MTMFDNLHADRPGLEGLIWIVFAILYGVAQLISRGRKKPPAHGPVSPAPGPEDDGYEAPEEEIRRFLESLTGAPARPQPAPASVPSPPPPPRRRYMKKAEPAQAPRPQQDHRASPPLAARPSTPEPEVPLMTLSTCSTIGKTNSFLVNLNSQRLHMMRVSIPTLRTTTHSVQPPELKRRGAFRRAMLSHIILSSPLAMGEDRSKFDYRS